MTQSQESELTLIAEIDSATVMAETDTLECHHYALLVESPTGKTFQGLKTASDSSLSSWLFLTLIVVFLLLCYRYRKSLGILSTIKANLQPSRERRNMFDDTVHESSFIILLDVISIVAMAMVAYIKFCPGYTPANPLADTHGVVVSIGLMAVMYVAQSLACLLYGYVFSGTQAARTWFQTFISSQAILAIVVFPLAMISLFYPQTSNVLAIIAIIAYTLSRILFVCKGYRIFSPYFASVLPFFYYLCAVEVVPVIFIFGLIARL